MARLTADEIVTKLITRAKNATGDYSKGVMRVTEAPGVKAARKKEKMRAGITAALDSGKWENAVAAVPLTKWQQAAVNKGAQRISVGLDEARNDMVAVFQQLNDHNDSIKTKIEQMPDLTPEQREERMLFQVREMRKFRKR